MLKAFKNSLPVAAIGATLLCAQPAAAEVELSFYSGYQTSPHSRITGNRGASSGGTAFSNLIGWEGKSFSMPPYYGVRATWWRSDDIGFGVEFSHNKVYAPNAEMPAGFTRLEFTDGLNLLTLNALYRFPLESLPITPYVGAGVGINVPHVEVYRPSGRTFEYQFGGATLQAQAGLSYRITDNWSTFVEYKGTYSFVDVDIDNGGSLKTDIITNAVNFGVAYKF